jgi:hypothetical protein
MSDADIQAKIDAARAEQVRVTALNGVVQESFRLAKMPGRSKDYQAACDAIAKFALAEMEREP